MDHKQIVLNYMHEHGSITSMEAFNLGITRLADVIFQLKKTGLLINTVTETKQNRYGKTSRYARYSLACALTQGELW